MAASQYHLPLDNQEFHILVAELSVLRDIDLLYKYGLQDNFQEAPSREALLYYIWNKILDSRLFDTEFEKGDYVVATKFEDGSSGDHFVLGFYGHLLPSGKHMILDGVGKPFRANGFARAKKVSREVGGLFYAEMARVEEFGANVWAVLRRIIDDVEERKSRQYPLASLGPYESMLNQATIDITKWLMDNNETEE